VSLSPAPFDLDYREHIHWGEDTCKCNFTDNEWKELVQICQVLESIDSCRHLQCLALDELHELGLEFASTWGAKLWGFSYVEEIFIEKMVNFQYYADILI
jgi:hypothetical protein